MTVPGHSGNASFKILLLEKVVKTIVICVIFAVTAASRTARS